MPSSPGERPGLDHCTKIVPDKVDDPGGSELIRSSSPSWLQITVCEGELIAMIFQPRSREITLVVCRCLVLTCLFRESVPCLCCCNTILVLRFGMFHAI